MGGSKRIQVLDGGMGTTLEALGANVSTPLWGCDLLQSNPSTIQNVHSQFRSSGADIIQTATYQLTLPTLCAHLDINQSTGRKIMQSAIPLASTSEGSIALSIGPFGATLSPGQEYAGIYPPPYGPSPTSSSTSSSNAISDLETLESAIKALEEFHLDRLLAFSEDKSIWDKVDWIAFETIPVLYEYTAIRRAIKRLSATGRAEKKFWISSAYPDGLHPQSLASGDHAGVEEMLVAALGGDLPPANGSGVNCTNPTYISSLSEQFSSTLVKLRQEGAVPKEGVTFVLYPDGGSVYDVNTRTWSSGGIDATSWGNQVSSVAQAVEARQVDGERVWEGVIVGGCCKAGFDEIKALRISLDRA